MSHSINKEHYDERFHPPVPRDEHIQSGIDAHEANKQLSEEAPKRKAHKAKSE
jgi:hypothetical protein